MPNEEGVCAQEIVTDDNGKSWKRVEDIDEGEETID